MAQKINQKTYFKTPVLSLSGAGLAGTKNASATLTTERTSSPGINKTVLTLAAQTVSVAAAADYGSLLLWTFPASRCYFLAADVVMTSTMSGFADDADHTTLDWALGTVAASNTTLASTMVDLIAKVDATGTTTGTIAGSTTTTEAPKFKAASTAVYFNVSNPVTSGTGLLSLTGTVTILWTDMASTT